MRSATLGVLHVIVLAVLLISSVQGAAPLFASLVLGLVFTLYAYLRFQELAWHHSADNELTFWLVYSMAAALIGLFGSDASPIAFERVGVPGVLCAFAYVAVVVVEKSRNDKLRLRSFRRSASRIAGSYECLSDMAFVAARSSATTIDQVCEELDAFAPSGQRVFGLWPCRAGRDEAMVESLLTAPASSDLDALNYIITHVNLARVFRVLRKRRHRLIDTLTSENSLRSLSVESKAALIDALQKVGLRAFGRSARAGEAAETGVAEEWVAHIVLSVSSHGELLRLRKLLDSSGDYFSMHKLVYRDMRPNSPCRAAILERIRTLCAPHAILARCARPSAPLPVPRDPSAPRRLKIVSDIDDTLFSSGGAFPAGCDKRFPKRTLYPGILELFRVLHADSGSDGTGDLALLSARPHTYKDLTENLSYAYFASLRQANLLHATPTLLAGDLTSSLQIVTKASAPTIAFEAVAAKKLDNFLQFAQLYPDYEVIFFGDNGQGDVRTAERMLQQQRAQVRLALIHLVQPIEQTFGWAGEGKAVAWQELGIRFYKTAIGAACHLLEEALLSVGSLRDVCTTTARQLEALRPKLAATGQLALCLSEFHEDLRRANQLLGEGRTIPMLEPAAAAQSAAAPAAADAAAASGRPRALSLSGLSRITGMRARSISEKTGAEAAQPLAARPLPPISASGPI